MKIKFKIIDMQKKSIPKIALLFLLLLPTINYLFIIYILLLLSLIVFQIVAYFIIRFFIKIEIEFLENELHIIKRKKILKIRYRDIRMIKISKNVFGTKNISINFYPIGIGIILWELFGDLISFGRIMILMHNSILLPNVVNYDEILNKLSEKTDINFNENCTIKLSYKYSLKHYLASLSLDLYGFYLMAILILHFEMEWLEYVPLIPIYIIILYILTSLKVFNNNEYFASIGDIILKIESKNEIYIFTDDFEVDKNKLNIKVFYPQIKSKEVVSDIAFRNYEGIPKTFTIE
ncbi:hypothetical protein [Oceanivirga salmonicida]|uniref:hypothetical protein n=1 Tax=Oceanivirga salmonicida TaxID=1769291 RepID=UPI0012E2FB34|nr:hypothetical protein [Oceanivirga salmonicida]